MGNKNISSLRFCRSKNIDFKRKEKHQSHLQKTTFTVRSGAEERRFWGARLDVLIFRLRSYHVLISYSAECSGPKFYKTLMFLGQAGTFLSLQARRSSAMRSSTSDLTVICLSWRNRYWGLAVHHSRHRFAQIRTRTLCSTENKL